MPSIATSEFRQYWNLGRVLHGILPTDSSIIAHIFGAYGLQGADWDREKLALAELLLHVVFCEALENGQPIFIAGFFNALPPMGGF